MNKVATALGSRLRELREQHDLSLRELAKKVRVSAPHLWDIETGRRDPSPDLLESLAKVLNVPLAELKKLDDRLPIEEIRRRREEEPRFGAALRHLLDSKITAKELDELLEKYVREEGDDGERTD